MNEVCIISARRTPIGRFLGSLARESAVDLACHAGDAVLADIDRGKIDQVIIGNILSAGQGMNIARQIGVHLGLPISAPAFTVNMMCASGMQAISLAAQAIRCGDANAILCGGTESMSNAPHLMPRSRAGIKLGDGKLVDSILRDGLVDSFDHSHMAFTAENLATKYDISREEQDAFAAESQRRYEDALQRGAFADELVVHAKLDADEHPRADTTTESLAGLKPAFDAEGSVTAGNASGINDGAAMLLLASREAAEANDWPIMAVVDDSASVGCDPKEMGLGPIYASRKLGVSLDKYDAVEINEAFAAQVLACLREMKLETDRINPNGGAIAMGHPVGASGARLVAHLAWQIQRGEIHSGLATLCVGGGMGSAISLKKP
ncbi:acetyl-CoA C-acyltransferase [Verrucomicrobiales bacterium]|mgnify:CR=1 FL=1|jgi:acetyl-CoA C-acetyltransferase|nr:acetyl-CoA C-acyltransferase [Verrucomicrobiales bacterium]